MAVLAGSLAEAVVAIALAAVGVDTLADTAVVSKAAASIVHWVVKVAMEVAAIAVVAGKVAAPIVYWAGRAAMAARSRKALALAGVANFGLKVVAALLSFRLWLHD